MEDPFGLGCSKCIYIALLILMSAIISPAIANYANLRKMASFWALVVLVWLVLGVSPISTTAADPYSFQDFCVADTSFSMTGLPMPCLNPSEVTPKHFMTSDLAIPTNTSASRFGFSSMVTDAQNLPGINSRGLSLLRGDADVGGIVPPHVHPRGDEVVFVVKGKLNVGFVDTSNKLFSADICAGDVFVFPKGLVHYLHNIGTTPAMAIASLNSEDPGFEIVPLHTIVHNPAIPTQVVSKAFKMSPQEVDKMRKGLGAK